jgi:FkbM family methyltransferase
MRMGDSGRSPTGGEVDYRSTGAGRRQSWFGLNRHVKRFLSLRVPHAALRAAVRVAPSLRSGRLPAPASLREVTGHIGAATFVMLHPDRCENAKALYWGGGRLPRPADAFALDLVARLARQADILLDVGAYTGLFSLACTAANPRLRVHAFEIVPAVADVLQENLDRNGVTARVTVHLEGVGEPDTRMRVPAGGGGSALPSFYSSRLSFNAGREIRFRSLDSVEVLFPVASRVVMKVDVEGTENAVFASGQDLLQRFFPDILCEVLDGVADGPRLEELLEPAGLRAYVVAAGGLIPRHRIVPDAHHRDWLFTAREPGELGALGIRVAAT